MARENPSTLASSNATGAWSVVRRCLADPDVNFNLGFALDASGRLHEAVACYQEALRLRPDCPQAQQSLRDAQQRLQRP